VQDLYLAKHRTRLTVTLSCHWGSPLIVVRSVRTDCFETAKVQDLYVAKHRTRLTVTLSCHWGSPLIVVRSVRTDCFETGKVQDLNLASIEEDEPSR
jgi:hypothetical protein